MKAVVFRKYGSPDVLRIEEVPTPSPRDHELRIRIHASTVPTSGGIMRRGRPYAARMMTGLRVPKVPIPGTDLAGVVEEVGRDVTAFRKGDRVFAASDMLFRAHAEYICLPQDAAVAPMPPGMDFAEAASLCEGPMTALPFLRDHGRVGPGMEVLIHGASGAIGTAGVQLARHLGARVTGVCSGRNAELVRSLGADRTIDYTREDFTRSATPYDVVFDTVGKSSFPASRRVLKEGGVYLCPVASLGILLQMLATARLGRKKAVFAATGLRPVMDKARDMRFLGELAGAGKLRPVIDRRYPMEKVAEAAAYVDEGHKVGNVVLTMLP